MKTESKSSIIARESNLTYQLSFWKWKAASASNATATADPFLNEEGKGEKRVIRSEPITRDSSRKFVHNAIVRLWGADIHRWQLHRRRHCSASDIPVRARTHGSYSLRSHNASTTLSSFSGLIDGGTLPCTTRMHGSTSRITNHHPRTRVETVLLRIIRDPFHRRCCSVQFFQNSPRGIPRELGVARVRSKINFSFIDPNCTVEFHSPNESVAIVPMIYIFKDFSLE